eukprot:7827767-Lingulodinium_polyedra.AAC.1
MLLLRATGPGGQTKLPRRRSRLAPVVAFPERAGDAASVWRGMRCSPRFQKAAGQGIVQIRARRCRRQR